MAGARQLRADTRAYRWEQGCEALKSSVACTAQPGVPGGAKQAAPPSIPQGSFSP
jgi:hypothetical protein